MLYHVFMKPELGISYFQRQIEIARIREGNEIAKTISERLRVNVNFPKTGLAFNGQLVETPAIIVSYGATELKQPLGLPPLPPIPGFVLTREGLFTSPCEVAKTPESNSSVHVPAIDKLQEATPEEYLKYGEKALELLELTLEAQLNR